MKSACSDACSRETRSEAEARRSRLEAGSTDCACVCVSAIAQAGDDAIVASCTFARDDRMLWELLVVVAALLAAGSFQVNCQTG